MGPHVPQEAIHTQLPMAHYAGRIRNLKQATELT